jgi:putative glycosyltransferase (TIGR04372 family)
MKMWRRTPSLHIWSLARYLAVANRMLPGGKKHNIDLLNTDTTKWRDLNGLLGKTSEHLRFTREEEEKGLKELQRMGTSNDSKFVCFIARDSSYLDAIYNGKIDCGYHNYRDASIDNYIPATEELVRRGYFAYRMGAVVNRPLTNCRPGVIDYATQYRSEFLDIYLCGKCHFFISSGTGIDEVARILRRPIVYVNYMIISCVNGADLNCITIFKKLWLRKEHRFMTFGEMLNLGSGFLHGEQYEKIGVDVVENTPEEIKSVVMEMDERLKGIWQTTDEDEKRQKLFWSLFKPSEFNKIFRSRIGTDFLRENQDLLR